MSEIPVPKYCSQRIIVKRYTRIAIASKMAVLKAKNKFTIIKNLTKI